MKLMQIAVFMENNPGRLAEVTEALANGGINIRALSMGDSADFGVLRLVVDRPHDARKLLKDHGFTVLDTEVLAVEIPDRPGGLSGALRALAEHGINVEYMYVLVARAQESAYVIFRFTDNDRAIGVLQDNNVRVLKGEEVYNV